jgi:hypothetical protein
MIHVFALMIFLGTKPVETEPMLFHSIDNCNYHAREVVRRYGSLITQRHFAIAYCLPKLVDKEDSEVIIY